MSPKPTDKQTVYIAISFFSLQRSLLKAVNEAKKSQILTEWEGYSPLFVLKHV